MSSLTLDVGQRHHQTKRLAQWAKVHVVQPERVYWCGFRGSIRQ
jgi:hypothetical protein